MTIEEINLRKPTGSMLTAISFEGFRILPNGGKSKYIKVECKCGNIKVIEAYDLSRGKTNSCGCTRKINSGKKSQFENNVRRVQKIWRSMKHRCIQTKDIKTYNSYKAKGIEVCDEWRNYQNFLDWALANGYKDGLTIDRIDNNKGYNPDNCRWVTFKEQCRNRTSNIIISHNGISKTLQEWSEIIHMNRDYLKLKIFQKGFTIEDIAKKKGISL